MVIPVLADSNEITTINIPTQNLTTGENKEILNLDNYFNGTDLAYKFKAGSKGLNGISISFDESLVNIIANNPGQYSVIFIADNETDDKESNDVNLNVVGEAIIKKAIDFFPVGTSVSMKVGEKKTFAVSGDNISAEWYLNNLKLPETTGTFIYDAAIAGTNTLEVKIGAETNIWTIIIEAQEVIETAPPPVVNQAVCGNNKKESGENCQSCPQDVQCTSGSSCVNAVCIKDQGVGGAILWFVGLGFVILLFVGGVVFAKRKGLLDTISLDFITNLFKKKEKIDIKEDEVGETEEDLTGLKDYLENNLKEGHSKEELVNAALQQGWKQEQIDKVFENMGEVKETERDIEPLLEYLKINLKKGYAKEELVKAVLEQGWTKEEIDDAFAKLGI